MGKEAKIFGDETYRELFRFSLDQASWEVYWITPDGKFLYTNETVKEKLGYSEDDLENMCVWDIDPNHGKEIREERWQTLKEEKTLTFESEHETKNGEIYPVEVTNRYIEFGGKEFEFVFAKDISERKEMEERKDFLHSLLRHDVRNKTQIVLGYLELTKDYNLPEEVGDYLSKAEKASKDGVEIIEKVRTLTKLSGEKETSEIEICSLIHNLIEERGDIFEENNIELECQEEEIRVLGGTLLEELFSNLIENAIKHANCDKIKISGKEENEKVIVTVEDDGCGIPEEDKEKVFNKGYTTDEERGSGLGLFLVETLLEIYGGRIEVGNSELGGVRFSVHLKKA